MFAGSLLILGGVASVGALASLAAATPDASSPLALLFGGGSTVVLAGIVGEVTRRLMNGRLIARETKESEQELNAYITAAGQREDAYLKIATDAATLTKRTAEELRAHNEHLATQVADESKRRTDQVISEMAALTRLVGDLRDEVRATRRGQQ